MTDKQGKPTHLFIFGMGYAAQVLAQALRAQGWQVEGTGRAGTVALTTTPPSMPRWPVPAMSCPPSPGARGGDPVLETYGAALQGWPGAWIGYWSSTGVYGDAQGAWVDETAPIGGGRARPAWRPIWRGRRSIPACACCACPASMARGAA
jgi:nucleoside-diphosphate-sugar epimerase